MVFNMSFVSHVCGIINYEFKNMNGEIISTADG